MREHIHRPDGSDFVAVRTLVFAVAEYGEVAGLRCRVAADIDHAFRRGIQYHARHVGVYAGSRRVQDHDVRASVALYEGVGKYILHIPGEEFAVVYAVRRCVYARVCDCVLYVFYAYDLRGRSADILGYGAGAGVEVIYDFLAAELREVPGQRVEAAGLGSV